MTSSFLRLLPPPATERSADAGGSDAQANGSGRERERSDDELMLLVAQNHEPALIALVQRYQRLCLGIAYKLLSDRSLAEDAAQDAFVQIARGARQYRPNGRFRAYLCAVVSHRAHDLARKRRSVERLDAFTASSTVHPTAEEALLEEERQRRVDAAICALPWKLRVVVVMRLHGNLAHPEIAAALGIPEGTVKSRMSHAIAQIREALGSDA